MENLAALPTDVLTLIADQLPLHEIHSFASVCRKFNIAAQWTISRYKRLSAIYAKVTNHRSHKDHHAEYLPDLLAKVVDDPGIGSCIRSLCIETTRPGRFIMKSGHPQVDRFRWELYRHAIRPFHLQDSKTRDEMDWIWQFCDDSVVIALLFYLAPRIRNLRWQVHEFNHRFLMRFLNSMLEARLGPSADFLSRLTSVNLVSAPNRSSFRPEEDRSQTHAFHSLAVVFTFMALPSMRSITCKHLTRIHMQNEAEPKFPSPGSSNVQELRFDNPTISIEEGDWLYSTIAAVKSLEKFQFTPAQSDYGDFATILTVLAKLQCESLRELDLLGCETHEDSKLPSIRGTKLVKSLQVFPNIRCIDIELDFLRGLMEASNIGRQSLAMILPSSIEHLKLGLEQPHQSKAEFQQLEEMARTKSSRLPRLETLHLCCNWFGFLSCHMDDPTAMISLTSKLHHECKAENVNLKVVAVDGEIEPEWY